VAENQKLKERCAHLEAVLDDEDVDIQEVLELIHRLAPQTKTNQLIAPKTLATK
jgi:hypothetical protein